MNHQSDYGYSTGALSNRCIACGSYDLKCGCKPAPVAKPTPQRAVRPQSRSREGYERAWHDKRNV